MAGVQKSFLPKQKLDEQFPWAQDFGLGTVRVIGASELLAAIGLVVPAATGILPILTPAAALGLVIVMALAMNTHRRRGETGAIVFNVVLLIAAAVVAWGPLRPVRVLIRHREDGFTGTREISHIETSPVTHVSRWYHCTSQFQSTGRSQFSGS